MKILMDSDCLIKFTKAGLKERICRFYRVSIPAIVQREVVDAGKAKGTPDAELVERNISDDLIHVLRKKTPMPLKGDQALVEVFSLRSYDAVATDDAKLVRLLKSMSIPCILPGLMIASLFFGKSIDHQKASSWLDDLSPFISEDEYSSVKLLMEREP